MLINKYNLIGLSGKKSSGKDTTAALIQILDYLKNESTFVFSDDEEMYKYLQGMIERHNQYNNLSPWRNMKYAGLLKEISGKLCNVSPTLYEYPHLKNQKAFPHSSLTHREVLQTLGHTMRSLLHNRIWIDALFTNYKSTDKWIISDCRYINEAEEIHNRGGLLIRIENPNILQDSHASECELDTYHKFDHVIINDGNVFELAKKINHLLFID
jgi:hypothetical protein